MTSDDPEAQKKVRPVPVHMWQGWEPNPGADVAGVGQSRRRCGQRCAVSFRPSRCGQVPGQMWAGFEYPEGFVHPINDPESSDYATDSVHVTRTDSPRTRVRIFLDF
jgi:hypothetical protein